MSLRDLRSPRPTSIAATGHAISHRPCPTHLSPFTTVAVPPTIPSTSPSGHASTHEPHPMHRIASMNGN